MEIFFNHKWIFLAIIWTGMKYFFSINIFSSVISKMRVYKEEKTELSIHFMKLHICFLLFGLKIHFLKQMLLKLWITEDTNFERNYLQLQCKLHDEKQLKLIFYVRIVKLSCIFLASLTFKKKLYGNSIK